MHWFHYVTERKELDMKELRNDMRTMKEIVRWSIKCCLSWHFKQFYYKLLNFIHFFPGRVGLSCLPYKLQNKYVSPDNYSSHVQLQSITASSDCMSKLLDFAFLTSCYYNILIAWFLYYYLSYDNDHY